MFQLKNTFEKIMEKIEKENKLTELLKIENTKELYAFLHENGYYKSEKEFKAEIEKLVEETAIDLEDSELGAVAGGTTKNKLTKLTSAGMASLLALGASPISSKAHARDVYYFSDYQAAAVQKSAKNNSSSAKKIILAALGIGGAGTVIGVGGLGAYMLYKHHKSKSNPQDVNPPPTADIKMSIEDEATPPEESTQEITDTPQETIDPPEQSYGGIEKDEPAPENPEDDYVGSSNPERTQEEPEQPEINEDFQRQLKEEKERRQREEEQARVEAERRLQKIGELENSITRLEENIKFCLEFKKNEENIECQVSDLKAQLESLDGLKKEINLLKNDSSRSLDGVSSELEELEIKRRITSWHIDVLLLSRELFFKEISSDAASLLREMTVFETSMNSLDSGEKKSRADALIQRATELVVRHNEEKESSQRRYYSLQSKFRKLNQNINKLKNPSLNFQDDSRIPALENEYKELNSKVNTSFDEAIKDSSLDLDNLEEEFEKLQTKFNEIKEDFDSMIKRQFGEYCELTPENEKLVFKIASEISNKLGNDLRNLVGVDIKDFQQSNDTGKEKTVQSSSQSDVINSVRTYFNYMCCAINNYVWPEGSDGHNLLNQKIATDDVPSMLNRLIVSCWLAPNLDQNKLKNVQECIRTIRTNYMNLNNNFGIRLFGYEIVDSLRDTGIRDFINWNELIKCNKFRAISEFLIALKEKNLIHNYQNIKLEKGGEEYTLEQLLQTPSLASGRFTVNINDENETQMYIDINDSSSIFKSSSPITKSQRETLEQVYGEIDWLRYHINQNGTELLCRAIDRAKELDLNIEKTENTHFDHPELTYPGNSFIKKLWKQNISNSKNIIEFAENEYGFTNIILIKILMDKRNNGSEVDTETNILDIIHMLSSICSLDSYFSKELLEASKDPDFKISKKWLMDQYDNVEYAESLISKLEKLGIYLP